MTLNELIKLLDDDGCSIVDWNWEDEEYMNTYDLWDSDEASSIKILLNNSPLYPSMVRWNPATKELNLTNEPS